MKGPTEPERGVRSMGRPAWRAGIRDRIEPEHERGDGFESFVIWFESGLVRRVAAPIDIARASL